MGVIKTKNLKKLIFIFKVYIRPILEFPSVVFNSDDPGKNRLLEKVQRKITMHIIIRSSSKGKHITIPKYPERIKILELDTLEARRQNLDLRYFENIKSGRVTINARNYIQPQVQGYMNTRFRKKGVIIQKARLKLRYNPSLSEFQKFIHDCKGISKIYLITI
jgi:hypothetical protein